MAIVFTEFQNSSSTIHVWSESNGLVYVNDSQGEEISIGIADCHWLAARLLMAAEEGE